MSDLRLGRALLVGSLTLAACGGTETGSAAKTSGGDVSASSGVITGSGKGFRVTMTGTTSRADASGVAAPSPTTSTTTVRLLDGKVRVDFAAGASPGMPKGGWMLVEADGGRMSMVDPSAKRVIIMDSLASLGGMADMGGVMQMTVKDTSSRIEDLGAGETVLGFRTHKYRTTIAYTMEMSMMGRAMPVRTEQVTVAHMSDDIGTLDGSFAAFETSMRSSMGGIAGNQAAAVMKALAATRPTGFPLQQEMETRVIRDGDTTSTRSSYRITELARGGVQPSDFVVPAEYTRSDLGAEVRGAQARATAAMKEAGGSERMRKVMEAMQKAQAAAAKR